MPDTIEFPTVNLLSFSRHKAGGDANFSSTFPKVIGDKLGWSGIPQGVTSAKLEGQLAATHVSLKPKDGELKKWKIEFDATNVSGFQVFRLELEGHKGKGFRIELRFKVSFADKKACAELEKYMTSVGEAKSTLTVSYVQQSELPMEDLAGDERRKATSEEED